MSSELPELEQGRRMGRMTERLKWLEEWSCNIDEGTSKDDQDARAELCAASICKFRGWNGRQNLQAAVLSESFCGRGLSHHLAAQ